MADTTTRHSVPGSYDSSRWDAEDTILEGFGLILEGREIP